jgi:hypothetical protein
MIYALIIQLVFHYIIDVCRAIQGVKLVRLCTCMIIVLIRVIVIVYRVMPRMAGCSTAPGVIVPITQCSRTGTQTSAGHAGQWSLER